MFINEEKEIIFYIMEISNQPDLTKYLKKNKGKIIENDVKIIVK